MTGVCLYTGHKGTRYDVHVEIFSVGNSYFKTKVSVPYTGDETPFKIPMDEQIVAKAGVVHTITAFAHSSLGYYGKPCQPICTNGNVTVTFPKTLGKCHQLQLRFADKFQGCTSSNWYSATILSTFKI